MEVEILFVEGFIPSATAMNNLENFLNQRLHKSKGTSFKYASIPSPGKVAYSVSIINEIEIANRTIFTRKDTIGVYFFFSDTGYDKDSDNFKVLESPTKIPTCPYSRRPFKISLAAWASQKGVS